MYIGFLMRNQYKKKNQNVCYYIMHNTKELQSAVSFLILFFFLFLFFIMRKIQIYDMLLAMQVSVLFDCRRKTWKRKITIFLQRIW